VDFPLAYLMDEDACYAKLVVVFHPVGLACPRCGEAGTLTDCRVQHPAWPVFLTQLDPELEMEIGRLSLAGSGSGLDRQRVPYADGEVAGARE
jgi:hypothetical protein